MRFKKISITEVLPLIKLSYDGDDELLSKYHVAPMALGQAVTLTMMMIDQTAKHKKLLYYKVIDSDKTVGYTVIGEDELYSFAFAKSFRRKDIFEKWWLELRKVLKKSFSCLLYMNNTRAINFLKRFGMEVINEDVENNVVVLLKT